MFARKDRELRALNRAHQDGWAQDDMAWLGLRGNVPQREQEIGGKLAGMFGKNPMLWAVLGLLAGSAIFLLVTLMIV